ncbi:MAG: archaemetzincin family Zn-dependent metalloprotease [Desulfobacula sp.]|jgi:archaemetzincin|uniref:archaemetzincin family Zn-dependent metalloprotease n=1 Tax=Desulfobacula sp. TaxID=2593537 RepID=UPI001D2EBF60|nr:archaemetzincin family Zn-dependent metalloprotease [Desulfobacula sp.]MBT3484946.1 archaemetzincin family Zn-dependent metalloprotease [Desulfobacula sp.]MBT3803218.1 archaemetzincin family Zn-dependent metalloprotease [Desulfobacula sp.]MBT4024601.1 archaemetzincin family Zn-dependent metalloprotease [Desulfobacula sp.]MBT4197575.1 archaemetzincin family Zn-dependent metalloprotease [Desulfobacula sp.]
MNNSGTIIVSPIGDIPQWISQTIARDAGEFFGFNAREEKVLDDILFAYDPERKQYHSTKILETLEKKAPSDSIKIIAVTKEDLFIPILTHVYGEAQLGGKACIISIARLITGLEAMVASKGYKRIIKEAIHELGHTFDLRHCEDQRCIMHYCRRIDDVDRKSSQFCRYCNIFLADNIMDLDGKNI